MHKDQITTAAGLVAELTAELKTHTYGIHSYELPATIEFKAYTTVTLLDDRASIVVALSRSGYVVTQDSDPKYKRFVDMPFETLTALLSALSPAFNSAMHQALSTRLMAIAAAQQEDDDEEDGSEEDGSDDDDSKPQE
ncbi:hypothetical protein GGI09_006891 [Coemansia sp. S100]|nr:hypothetical protein LPJ71_003757 [Coemansia sp. S17]KAJ2085415.1 hypothetical protein GGI09_006891 [Coemansia sp. S100]KAJ2109237.1 hypothetical protein GGI16_000807 [Coemansia sp. S142-1]